MTSAVTALPFPILHVGNLCLVERTIEIARHGLDVPTHRVADVAREVDAYDTGLPIIRKLKCAALSILVPKARHGPLHSVKNPAAGLSASCMPCAVKRSMSRRSREQYMSRYRAMPAWSCSKAATTPAAIGATNPVSVLPLTTCRSPMKSGEPTMAPICHPVPLPMSFAAVKASAQERSGKSRATSDNVRLSAP